MGISFEFDEHVQIMKNSQRRTMWHRHGNQHDRNSIRRHVEVYAHNYASIDIHIFRRQTYDICILNLHVSWLVLNMVNNIQNNWFCNAFWLTMDTLHIIERWMVYGRLTPTHTESSIWWDINGRLCCASVFSPSIVFQCKYTAYPSDQNVVTPLSTIGCVYNWGIGVIIKRKAKDKTRNIQTTDIDYTWLHIKIVSSTWTYSKEYITTISIAVNNGI